MTLTNRGMTKALRVQPHLEVNGEHGQWAVRRTIVSHMVNGENHESPINANLPTSSTQTQLRVPSTNVSVERISQAAAHNTLLERKKY